MGIAMKEDHISRPETPMILTPTDHGYVTPAPDHSQS
jgi:hypothetical protein